MESSKRLQTNHSSEFTSEGYRLEDGALLAGADASRFPQVDIPADIGKQEPKFAGGFDAFMAASPELESQAFNLIRKCTSCGKPCATSMDTCNGCGQCLAEVAVTKSPNLFFGFIYGVDKAGFPLKISLRSETPDMLVFDDPLALTRAHVLAVPSDVYCPDIRSLFHAPAEGLELVRKMEEAAWAALVAGPLASEEWRRKALSDAAFKLPVADLRKHVVAAFNLPPSQYQIHMQYMLLPLTPAHVGVLRKGAHFVKGRHFPMAYVVAALRAFIKAGEALPKAGDMKPSQLIEAIARKGIDYDAAHSKDLADMHRSNAFLANYDPADFSYACIDGKMCNKDTGRPVEGAPSAKDIDGADKLALQGYGRPYLGGKPGGVYYSYARAPALLKTF